MKIVYSAPNVPAYIIGDHKYVLTRVVIEDGKERYDLGDVALDAWKVHPHKRNRIINNFDAAARTAWLEELEQE